VFHFYENNKSTTGKVFQFNGKIKSATRRVFHFYENNKSATGRVFQLYLEL